MKRSINQSIDRLNGRSHNNLINLWLKKASRSAPCRATRPPGFFPVSICHVRPRNFTHHENSTDIKLFRLYFGRRRGKFWLFLYRRPFLRTVRGVRGPECRPFHVSFLMWEIMSCDLTGSLVDCIRQKQAAIHTDARVSRPGLIQNRFYLNPSCRFLSIIRLIVRSLDWLIDWLISCFIDWLIDWLLARLIDWLIDRLIDWLIDWFGFIFVLFFTGRKTM